MNNKTIVSKKDVQWFAFASLQEQSLALAKRVAQDIEQCLDDKGRATVCVPGGSTPATFLKALSAIPLDWSKTTIVLNDERWVPIGDPLSNEAMLRHTLLHDYASDANIVGFYPNDAATTQSIETAVEDFNRTQLPPILPIDICVLGMGKDGHFASLFPHMPNLDAALNPQQQPALIKAEPPAKETRVSFNLSGLLTANKHYLLIKGSLKKEIVREAQKMQTKQLPISYLIAHTSVAVYHSH